MINEIDNRDKWFLERWGNFTASEMWKLLKKGDNNQGFSVGGKTYIQQKAIETMTVLWERPELDEVESLLHGKVYELPAFEAYVKESKNYSMKYFGTDNPVYLPYNEYSGGSPDSLMGEGETVYLGSELKCPKNSGNHYRYLKFKTQWDLKEARIEYYTQIQFLMMCCKSNPEFHFVSYDERFKEKKLKLKILPVMPDTKFQDNLELRIMAAQKEKLRIIEELNNGL